MSNMAHCRFKNTYQDLYDCFEYLYDNGFHDLSEIEKKYAILLIHKCNDFQKEFSHIIPK